MVLLRVLVLAAVVVTIQARCLGPPSTENPANITILNLSNCSFSFDDNTTFDVFSSLKLLDLSNNNIFELPSETLINLTCLQILDLSHNLLQTIYDSPFRTLKSLKVLNLSGNAIDVISVDAFQESNSLQNLDLSKNNLTKLPDGVFAPLLSLQHLNLSGNRLQTLADGCFGSLLRLQQLDVSWNQLNRVEPSTLQALPSLARLLLADNPTLGLGVKEAALLVGTGRRLQTVDASRTGLKHVPATLTHSVRTLRLAGNSIRFVRCGDLDSYPLLQLLDLTTNSLEEIEEDALGRLEMLAVLYLTDNKLRAIPRSLPDRLEILHLEYNKIEQIVSGDLLGLPKLEVLLLNDNAIKVVQEGAFNQVTSLVTLDLSRNPISILPGDTLAGPVRLQMLRLSELKVQPPAEDMGFPVPAPEHLVRLDLSGSVGLARQLLSDTAALAAFRELQELNLADTELTNVRSDLLHYLPQMHEFHLTGNQLNCTGLLWLALWMRRQDQPEYRKVACASPPELYGTLVVDLQDTYVQESSTTVTTTSSTLVTNDLTITTTYSSISTSTIITEPFENETWSEEVVDNKIKNKMVEVVGLENMMEKENKKQIEVESEWPTLNRSHLFPTAASTVPSVSDRQIEISPSDIRVATEASNYTGDVVVAAAAVAEGAQGGVRFTPGLFALLAAALGAGAALCSLVSHVRRRRRQARRANYDRHQDIEVSSLASVHELW